MCDLDWRKEIPEPGAGIPLRQGFGSPRTMLERPDEEDSDFDIYLVGFIDNVSTLEKLQKPWLKKIPMDDPIYAGEIRIRGAEKLILEDL
eukprot:3525987-Karenia_brevis.AAC.1